MIACTKAGGRSQEYREFRKWEESTRRSYTSLLIGTRPDLYRIYNKVDEIKPPNWTVAAYGFGHRKT